MQHMFKANKEPYRITNCSVKTSLKAGENGNVNGLKWNIKNRSLGLNRFYRTYWF